MPIKSKNNLKIIYVDQYFFYAMQHYYYTESHSVINFTIEKLNFSKLLINLVFFGYTTGILYWS
jgi:hypothetical protein